MSEPVEDFFAEVQTDACGVSVCASIDTCIALFKYPGQIFRADADTSIFYKKSVVLNIYFESAFFRIFQAV